MIDLVYYNVYIVYICIYVYIVSDRFELNELSVCSLCGNGDEVTAVYPGALPYCSDS
jgi:hypothetical protein